MFSTRSDFAANDELIRQDEIVDVIFYGKFPTTLIKKKAASIVGHEKINIIARAKIYQSLDYLLTFILKDEDLQGAQVKERIKNYLKSVNIEIGTPLMLPKKLPVLTLQPEVIPKYDILLDTTFDSFVNIGEFEYMCFKNKIRFRYLRDTSFAAYMFQNILFYLNAKTSEELIGNDAWQAQYAILLERTDFSDYIAMQAFYDDVVSYRGLTYNTSFVPKYDVKNLSPQDRINIKTSDNEMINYYYSLNVHIKMRIPTNMIGIFLIFPFKNGHYIKPTGDIVHLKLRKYATSANSRLLISNLCNMYDIESAIESAARSISLDDAIHHAVYSKNLKEQSIALLILRRLVGDNLTIGEERIAIPSEINVLSWSKKSCSETKINMPIQISDKSYKIYLELIQDIAASCGDKLTASLLCSQFFIPEMNIADVYSRLSSDAERYVLLTMILQEYRLESYDFERKRLNPIFGTSLIDLSKYPIDTRLFSDTLVSDHLDTLSVPLLLPSDINSGVNVCNPYSCSELYEFTNVQLKELAKTGDVSLNNEQLANFITLMVY